MIHAVELSYSQVTVDVDVGLTSVRALVNATVGSNVHIAIRCEHHFVHVGVNVDVCAREVERVSSQLSLLVGA